MKAQIITAWETVTIDGLGLVNRPVIRNDYPELTPTDVTGQPAENIPPENNMYIVEIDTDQTTLDAIELDNNYLVLHEE